MAKVLFILSGGIACYKSAYTIRLLRKLGHTVQPIMTHNAMQFITPLTLTALSGNVVKSEVFDIHTESHMDHIHLSRKCDVVLVAPATANFIAKMAMGLCDDLASTVITASNKPIVIAPAMNPHMWKNPANQQNIQTLKQRGFIFINPTDGDMACGETGTGRLAESQHIADFIHTMVAQNTLKPPKKPAQPLAGKSFIMTVGGTSEPIDTVRVLTNTSSGIQGALIAQELLNRGAIVHIVCGQVTIDMPIGATVYPVKTAQQMYDKVHHMIHAHRFNGAVMAAAVSDYRVANALNKKHKKSDGALSLQLVENPDILHSVCVHKNRPNFVVGFAAETHNITAYATEKLHKKGCDILFANIVQDHTFGGDMSHGYLVDTQGITDLGYNSKFSHAEKLADTLVQHMA